MDYVYFFVKKWKNIKLYKNIEKAKNIYEHVKIR